MPAATNMRSSGFLIREAMLDQAAREGKPVFIDFYADWCVPCKEMDVQTFTVPEVVTRSRDFVMLKVDLTSTEDPKAEALREKYQVKGVPTLVFLQPGRERNRRSPWHRIRIEG